MKLVDNPTQAWRWISMNMMALGVATQLVWAALPDDMRESLPRSCVQWMTIAILAIGIVGRMIKQKAVTTSDEALP